MVWYPWSEMASHAACLSKALSHVSALLPTKGISSLSSSLCSWPHSPHSPWIMGKTTSALVLRCSTRCSGDVKGSPLPPLASLKSKSEGVFEYSCALESGYVLVAVSM